MLQSQQFWEIIKKNIWFFIRLHMPHISTNSEVRTSRGKVHYKIHYSHLYQNRWEILKLVTHLTRPCLNTSSSQLDQSTANLGRRLTLCAGSSRTVPGESLVDIMEETPSLWTIYTGDLMDNLEQNSPDWSQQYRYQNQVPKYALEQSQNNKHKRTWDLPIPKPTKLG